jgi:prepilin signal peptidase PulO-like enzyme (type II secretory pathway)
MGGFHFFLLGVLFLYGAAVGSFVNVVIDRLPLGKSLLGRSRCDYTGRHLEPIELIPIFSYVIQKGKTRDGQHHLKLQYPLVEFFMGCAFVVVARASGILGSLPSVSFHEGARLAMILSLVALSVAIAGIDARHRIIPNSLTLLFLLCAVAYRLAGDSVIDGVTGAIACTIPIFLIYLATRSHGMGYGDIKLAFALGMWLGWERGLFGLYIGFLCGGIVGVWLLLSGKARRKSQIAFGPFLLAGAWLSHFFGHSALPLLLAIF